MPTDQELGLNAVGLLDYQDSDKPVEDERPDESQLLGDEDGNTLPIDEE